MPKIFLSYRRDDTAFPAQPIYEGLTQEFGENSVVYDGNFAPGRDFHRAIRDGLATCDILLALIGDRWATIQYEDAALKGIRRLDDPKDWLRQEIASGLGEGIPVIPVLVGKVTIADISKNLPSDLADLTKHQAIRIRAGDDFERDLKALIRATKRALRLPPLTVEELTLPLAVSVKPQSLRPFDGVDSKFFTYLLPNRRDDDMPDCLRRFIFGKPRIESARPENAFRVGLIIGPEWLREVVSRESRALASRRSACGSTVYVKVTPTDIESQLIGALSQDCPFFTRGTKLASDVEAQRADPRRQEGASYPGSVRAVPPLDARGRTGGTRLCTGRV